MDKDLNIFAKKLEELCKEYNINLGVSITEEICIFEGFNGRYVLESTFKNMLAINYKDNDI